jgi:hypothetical protein
MPRRFVPTERQRKVLQHIGLMPLTDRPAISKRFGIPLSELLRIEKEKPSRRLALELAKRFAGHPQKTALSFHPKIWLVHRIAELAPTHSNREIHLILIEEKTAHPALGEIEIPRAEGVGKIISVHQLRTSDETSALRNRAIRKPDRNNLSPEQRAMLLSKSDPFIRGVVQQLKQLGRFDDSHQMMDAIVDAMQHALKKVEFANNADKNELRGKWFGFLKSRKVRNIILSNVATRLKRENAEGQKRIRLPKDKSQHPTHEVDIFQKPTKEKIQITYSKPLTPREREIVELLKEGKRPIEIARIVGLGRQAISYHLKKIRKKSRIN